MSARRLAPADLPAWLRALRAELAAAYVGGICLTTLYKLVADGRLPAPVRLGGVIVWLREDLDAALDALQASGRGLDAPRGGGAPSRNPYRDAVDDDRHAPALRQARPR